MRAPVCLGPCRVDRLKRFSSGVMLLCAYRLLDLCVLEDRSLVQVVLSLGHSPPIGPCALSSHETWRRCCVSHGESHSLSSVRRPCRLHRRVEPVVIGQVPPKSAKAAWDSNVITPGTSFMHRLSDYLRFYVQERVNRDKAWQSIKVRCDSPPPGQCIS